MGQVRLSFLALTLLACGLSRVQQANAGSVLFLVAENPSIVDPCSVCDSFVLSLSDPAHIAEARDIIARGGVGGPGMGVIALAQIAEGADGVNRDLLAPGAPEWSWHVTGLVEFAEGTIEILDGTPSTVEADVNGWIANTNGHIGFWSYTVVQEVPEPSGPTLLGVGSGVLLLARRLRRRHSQLRS